MSEDEVPTTPPITKNDIVRKQATTRRAFLGVAGAGVVAAATGLTLSSAGAQETPDGGAEEDPKTHCTDSDTGAGADPVGGGDRCSTGCTDSDSGSGADRAGAGDRCGGGSSRSVDRDTGCEAD